MEINTRRFRLSVYQPHKVTGEKPARSFSYGRFKSDNNCVNYFLEIGLWTVFVKIRSAPQQGGSDDERD